MRYALACATHLHPDLACTTFFLGGYTGPITMPQGTGPGPGAVTPSDLRNRAPGSSFRTRRTRNPELGEGTGAVNAGTGGDSIGGSKFGLHL